MAYITIAELKEQFPDEDFGQLANDATGLSSGPTYQSTILSRILDSDSYIDSYLNQRYDVPLTTVPNSIRNASGLITYYRLHERRPEMIGEQLQRMYDQTVAWLRDIAKGIVSLPTPPASEGGKTSAYFGGQTRIFQGVSHDEDTDMMNGF